MRASFLHRWNGVVAVAMGMIVWPAAALARSDRWIRYLDAGYRSLANNHLAESEREYRGAALQAQELGPYDLRLSETLEDFANVYYAEGQVSLARPLCAQAQFIETHVLGPEKRIAHDLVHRAWISRIQGRYPQAEAFAKRVLALTEKRLGHDSRETASALVILGDVYTAEQKYGPAEPLYRRALAIRERRLGPNHLLVASALDPLGDVYCYQKRYSSAEPLLKRAIAIREAALGPYYPSISYSLARLATVYYEQRRYPEADAAESRALSIRERVYGSQNPRTVSSMLGLGNIARASGKYGPAEMIYTRALESQAGILEVDRRDVASTLFLLGQTYELDGKYAQSESFYQRALALDEKRLGPRHPETARIRQSLAAVRLRQASHGR